MECFRKTSPQEKSTISPASPWSDDFQFVRPLNYYRLWSEDFHLVTPLKKPTAL